VFDKRLDLEDFAIRKINWRPKSENFEEILREANLLPGNIVYIDDNPVERALIKAAFPGVRVLGSNPLIWRRILLWSAETQVSTITAESAARTDMVRAQVERELQRRRFTREDFLISLGVQVTLREIGGRAQPGFTRALELINKSNQFNTTGRRWTELEFVAALASGMRCFIFEVTDKFTSYGIVGVALWRGAHIAQFVMSCRVVGLEVEIAVIAGLLRVIMSEIPVQVVTAELVETELNLLARDVWERCRFRFDGGRWSYDRSQALEAPAHIEP
jgi:FkbH-like protein